MDILADVIRVERWMFQSISVSIGHATMELVWDGMAEGWILYLRMSASNVLLHKIVINCLRPKFTSKTDVSNSEVNLMYAINASKKFSLPHTIMFHMYRSMVNDKGQLSYSTLVTQLFRHFNIQPPCVRTCDQMVVGLKMVSKMHLKELCHVPNPEHVPIPLWSIKFCDFPGRVADPLIFKHMRKRK